MPSYVVSVALMDQEKETWTDFFVSNAKSASAAELAALRRIATIVSHRPSASLLMYINKNSSRFVLIDMSKPLQEANEPCEHASAPEDLSSNPSEAIFDDDMIEGRDTTPSV